MRDWLTVLGAGLLAACVAAIGGCGLAYQAGSRIKTSHMENRLKVGESAIQVHHDWGEPDLRRDLGEKAELWSYASHPNNNDLAASLFYTSTKSGDEGKFLDLKFVNGQLVSWSQSERTMPAKQGAGFSYGFGGGGGGSPLQHY